MTKQLGVPSLALGAGLAAGLLIAAIPGTAAAQNSWPSSKVSEPIPMTYGRRSANCRHAIGMVGTKPTFNALYSTLPFIELRSAVADTGDIEIAPMGAGDSTTPEKGTSDD